MTVRISNFAGDPYTGWVRTVVGFDTPTGWWQYGNYQVHVGPGIVADGRIADIFGVIPARSVVKLNTADAMRLAGPPNEEFEPRGAVEINGQALRQMPVRTSGIGRMLHYRGRPLSGHPMLAAEAWVTQYSGQGWAVGELVLCASNPDVPDLHVTLTHDIKLGAPDAELFVDGHGKDEPLIKAGDYLGDGQARSFRFVIVWGDQDPVSANIQRLNLLSAIGIEQLSPFGSPKIPEGYDAGEFVRKHRDAARDRLKGWDAGDIGVAAKSGQTGAQEDQGYAKGFEILGKNGLGAEQVRYYAALGQSRRPMHHLTADGELLPLDITDPRLIFWDARPHWHKGVSPNQLGKADGKPSTHGWWGPDRQHWFINTLAAAYQVTGSPALQWQLQAHARVFLYQETVTAGWSTSGPDAARSMGWAGIVAVHLFRLLEDPRLAHRVRMRFLERCDKVYIPFWNRKLLWDEQTDPRVIQYVHSTDYPKVSMLYQSALGAMGIEMAGQVFGRPAIREHARKQAQLILDHGYDDKLNAWEIVGVRPDGTLATELIEGVSAHRTGWFDGAWMPCAAWVVLQHDKDNEKAKAILANATKGDRINDWLPDITPQTNPVPSPEPEPEPTPEPEPEPEPEPATPRQDTLRQDIVTGLRQLADHLDKRQEQKDANDA